MVHTPGCRCRHCEPGLTRTPAGGPDLHHIDAQDVRLAFRLLDGQIARQIASGTCTGCGLNRSSRSHREQCEEPRRPVAAPVAIRQPWEPRPSRRALRAA